MITYKEEIINTIAADLADNLEMIDIRLRMDTIMWMAESIHDVIENELLGAE